MSTANSNRDRRVCLRFPAHLAVKLQPVDNSRQPLGDAIDAVSVDLSQSGICCISDRPLSAEFAIVRVLTATSENEMVLLAKRIRCQRNSVMFELALQFIEKLSAEAE